MPWQAVAKVAVGRMLNNKRVRLAGIEIHVCVVGVAAERLLLRDAYKDAFWAASCQRLGVLELRLFRRSTVDREA